MNKDTETFGSFQAKRTGIAGALFTETAKGLWVLLARFDRYGDAVAAARLFHIHTEVKEVY